jgi:hypothetical protein
VLGEAPEGDPDRGHGWSAAEGPDANVTRRFVSKS